MHFIDALCLKNMSLIFFLLVVWLNNQVLIRKKNVLLLIGRYSRIFSVLG